MGIRVFSGGGGGSGGDFMADGSVPMTGTLVAPNADIGVAATANPLLITGTTPVTPASDDAIVRITGLSSTTSLSVDSFALYASLGDSSSGQYGSSAIYGYNTNPTASGSGGPIRAGISYIQGQVGTFGAAAPSATGNGRWSYGVVGLAVIDTSGAVGAGVYGSAGLANTTRSGYQIGVIGTVHGNSASQLSAAGVFSLAGNTFSNPIVTATALIADAGYVSNSRVFQADSNGATQFKIAYDGTVTVTNRVDSPAVLRVAPAATIGASQAGLPINITASDAVASTNTAGAAAGGGVTITSGAAARNTSGDANGGAVNIVTGAGIGTGTYGSFVFKYGATASDAVTISPTQISGNTNSGGLKYQLIHNSTTASLRLASDTYLGWNSTTNLGGGAIDTVLQRHSAGVVRSSTTGTSINGFLGGGAAVASATALPLPTGRVFHVTGTTTITSITSTNFGAGAVITLIFDDVLTFTDGSNLVLAGNFVTTASDTITLAYDGTNWYETSRSIN